MVLAILRFGNRARAQRSSSARNRNRSQDYACSLVRRCFLRILLEDQLDEVIQVVSPMGWIVSMSVDVPDVRHVVLLQVSLQTLADSDQSIFVST
jgi:hypothetical protein